MRAGVHDMYVVRVCCRLPLRSHLSQAPFIYRTIGVRNLFNSHRWPVGDRYHFSFLDTRDFAKMVYIRVRVYPSPKCVRNDQNRWFVEYTTEYWKYDLLL